ncbi:hypothetical protein LZ30DRAFT_707789 [Colletotrichum cereale]|nr:hypothetical protein LZ30DRAFT_707789 [Colletotrichum cereale]
MWWMANVVGELGCLNSQIVKEGDGHEIRLTGDTESAVSVVICLRNRKSRYTGLDSSSFCVAYAG